MNERQNLILKFIFYDFELGHNAVEATKNIFLVKDEGPVDHSTITRWFEETLFELQEPQ